MKSVGWVEPSEAPSDQLRLKTAKRGTAEADPRRRLSQKQNEQQDQLSDQAQICRDLNLNLEHGFPHAVGPWPRIG